MLASIIILRNTGSESTIAKANVYARAAEQSHPAWLYSRVNRNGALVQGSPTRSVRRREKLPSVSSERPVREESSNAAVQPASQPSLIAGRDGNTLAQMPGFPGRENHAHLKGHGQEINRKKRRWPIKFKINLAILAIRL